MKLPLVWMGTWRGWYTVGMLTADCWQLTGRKSSSVLITCPASSAGTDNKIVNLLPLWNAGSRGWLAGSHQWWNQDNQATHRYSVTPLGMGINNQTRFDQYLELYYHCKHLGTRFNSIQVLWQPSELFKARLTRECILCCAEFAPLKICQIPLCLIRSELSHLLCQQNWQFASSSEPSDCRGRSISPRVLMKSSHTRPTSVTQRGSAAMV